jgi:RNA polymerase sigma-70 factor (ECF subfamily)
VEEKGKTRKPAKKMGDTAEDRSLLDDSLDEEPRAVEDILADEPTDSAPVDKETELFNRFLAGNDQAYRTLYDAFERPLYAYCCRLLGSEANAQDVFQDIWIRMYRLRGERTSVRRFSGLLFTIARNLSLNAIRDAKQSHSVSLEDIPPEHEGFMRTAEFDDADLREMLQKALAQLPFNQREAFVLREYSGYNYNEIAAITGASMINVKTRAWRARERLRKVISAWLELRIIE